MIPSYSLLKSRRGNISRDRSEDLRETLNQSLLKEKAEYDVVWRGLEIQVAYTLNCFPSVHHLEVRCDSPLPITETGYRSYFFAMGSEPLESPGKTVLDLLDEEAKESRFDPYSEDQMDLFS